MSIDLLTCPIFDSLEANNKGKYIYNLSYKIKKYPRNTLIFRQNDTCDALYILMNGSVKTEMITESGNLLGIEILKAPCPLAPAFLFSDNNRFPVDVTALNDVEIAFIYKNEVMRLMAENPAFMQEYMKYSANRAQFLADRLQISSIKTIRKKFAYYLLQLNPENKTDVELDRNQTELADYLGVTRPALARTIAEMEQDGIIKATRKHITILNPQHLRNSIYQ